MKILEPKEVIVLAKSRAVRTYFLGLNALTDAEVAWLWDKTEAVWQNGASGYDPTAFSLHRMVVSSHWHPPQAGLPMAEVFQMVADLIQQFLTFAEDITVYDEGEPAVSSGAAPTSAVDTNATLVADNGSNGNTEDFGWPEVARQIKMAKVYAIDALTDRDSTEGPSVTARAWLQDRKFSQPLTYVNTPGSAYFIIDEVTRIAHKLDKPVAPELDTPATVEEAAEIQRRAEALKLADDLWRMRHGDSVSLKDILELTAKIEKLGCKVEEYDPKTSLYKLVDTRTGISTTGPTKE